MPERTNRFTAQVVDLIDREIEPLESGGRQVDPELIAVAVASNIDPSDAAPPLTSHCAILQIKHLTRARLRKRHDPVAKMKDALEFGDDTQIEMFEQLQEYYPALRPAAPGEMPRRVYVPRGQLTETDVAHICKRMRRAGAALIKHADNLEAWYVSENQGSAA